MKSGKTNDEDDTSNCRLFLVIILIHGECTYTCLHSLICYLGVDKFLKVTSLHVVMHYNMWDMFRNPGLKDEILRYEIGQEGGGLNTIYMYLLHPERKRTILVADPPYHGRDCVSYSIITPHTCGFGRECQRAEVIYKEFLKNNNLLCSSHSSLCGGPNLEIGDTTVYNVQLLEEDSDVLNRKIELFILNQLLREELFEYMDPIPV